MPAIQTPRTHGYPTDVIAGKPAPTKPAPACRSRACPRCKRRELTDTPPRPSQASLLQQGPRQPVGAGLARDANAANSRTPRRRHRKQASSNKARASLWERVLPAMQTPRTRGHPTDVIAGKPAPTAPAPACRSRACPRCKRRELTDTPPTSSQASLLQQSPRKLWERGLCATDDQEMALSTNSWASLTRRCKCASSIKLSA